MKTYNIGEKVWYAGMSNKKEFVVCPECFGKKFVTVILGDDSRVTIDCAGCSSGFDPPRGSIYYYKWSVNVEQIIIEGVEINKNKNKEEVRYRYNSCYIADSNKVFSDKKQAEEKAMELIEEHNQDELKKINSKEKSNRSWAWNAHYHRNCIRNCEKDLMYHKEKLNSAESKLKKEVNNVSK
jgi:hypothetical protein